MARTAMELDDLVVETFNKIRNPRRIEGASPSEVRKVMGEAGAPFDSSFDLLFTMIRLRGEGRL